MMLSCVSLTCCTSSLPNLTVYTNANLHNPRTPWFQVIVLFKMDGKFLENRVSALEDKIFGDLDKTEQYTKVSD